MEYAFLLLITAAVAVGVVSAVVRTWSLHSRTYSLEDRVAVLEGTMTREVKSRAAQARWTKPDKDEALMEQLLAAKTPAARQNWWDNTGAKKGGYTP